MIRTYLCWCGAPCLATQNGQALCSAGHGWQEDFQEVDEPVEVVMGRETLRRMVK